MKIEPGMLCVIVNCVHYPENNGAIVQIDKPSLTLAKSWWCNSDRPIICDDGAVKSYMIAPESKLKPLPPILPYLESLRDANTPVTQR